jgi:hypothetical protein
MQSCLEAHQIPVPKPWKARPRSRLEGEAQGVKHPAGHTWQHLEADRRPCIAPRLLPRPCFPLSSRLTCAFVPTLHGFTVMGYGAQIART